MAQWLKGLLQKQKDQRLNTQKPCKVRCSSGIQISCGESRETKETPWKLMCVSAWCAQHQTQRERTVSERWKEGADTEAVF